MPNRYTDRKGVEYETTNVLIPVDQKEYAREHGLNISHILRVAMSEKMRSAEAN